MLNSLVVSGVLSEILYKTECMIILEANLSYEHIYLNIHYMSNKGEGNSTPYNLAADIEMASK